MDAPLEPTDRDVAEGAELRLRMAEAARRDLVAFLYWMNPQHEGAEYLLDNKFVISAFHVYLAELAQGAFTGRLHPNHAVSVPPQHGKSTTITVFAIAWLMAYRPGVAVAITGHSHALMVKFSEQVKAVVRSDLYQALFPGLSVLPGHDRQDDWGLDNKSTLIARSCGKKLIGRRADVLVIDDPHPGREEAESVHQRGRVKTWYFADCCSRLSPGAVQFLIGTRFHPQDLIGHLTGDDYEKALVDAGHPEKLFEVTNLPAICEDPAGCPLGREEGEALFPEVRPLHFLEGERAAMPGYEWDSQYQQRPRPASSGATDFSKVRLIDESEVPEGLAVARGWDTASSTAEASDYSAGAKGCFDEATGNFYIMHVARLKLMWTKLRPEVKRLALEDLADPRRPAHTVAMEGVAQGASLVHDIREFIRRRQDDPSKDDPEGCKVRVVQKNPGKKDKLLRAQPWLNMVEAGKVYLVRGPWVRPFQDEFEVFPKGAHDDQIDAVSVLYETVAKPRKLVYA